MQKISRNRKKETWLTMNKQIVTVKQGKLAGAVLKSALGSLYIAFREIPFAAPPIGDLRFKVYIYNIFYILYCFTLLEFMIAAIFQIFVRNSKYILFCINIYNIYILYIQI